MQRLVRKIYLLFGLFILNISFSNVYDGINYLKKGDVFFEAKEYSKALEEYESYIYTENKASKSLINKVLFISVLQGDTVKELTYTALAYKMYPSFQLKKKLNNTTDYYGKGRSFVDFNSWFYLFKFKYETPIGIIILLLLSLSFVAGAVSFLKKQKSYRLFFGVTVVFCFLLFSFLNMEKLFKPYKHYVLEKDVMLRTKPSYVSDVLFQEVKQGELLLIEKETGVWIEVLYKNEKFYLPQSKKPFLF